jgi:pimeloyl-ACP methyl ester carboxylesterase
MTINQFSYDEKPPVIFVPGGVMPGSLSYGPLLNMVGNQIQAIVKELEVYATDSPPADYGLELEVEAIRRAADAAGVDCFHLVGYSAGGAASLAFAARYPERLRSLALIEPAWSGPLLPEDAEDWAVLKRVMTLPQKEQMAAFIRWHMRPGVEPPELPQPPGPPPEWMARRPAGLKAISSSFNNYNLDRNCLRSMKQPVYYALGSLSTRFYARAATTLCQFFVVCRWRNMKGAATVIRRTGQRRRGLGVR